MSVQEIEQATKAYLEALGYEWGTVAEFTGSPEEITVTTVSRKPLRFIKTTHRLQDHSSELHDIREELRMLRETLAAVANGKAGGQ